jgi:hypothetical protein
MKRELSEEAQRQTAELYIFSPVRIAQRARFATTGDQSEPREGWWRSHRSPCYLVVPEGRRYSAFAEQANHPLTAAGYSERQCGMSRGCDCSMGAGGRWSLEAMRTMVLVSDCRVSRRLVPGWSVDAAARLVSFSKTVRDARNWTGGCSPQRRSLSRRRMVQVSKVNFLI